MDKENNTFSGQQTLRLQAILSFDIELEVEPDCTFVTWKRLVVVFCPLGILNRETGWRSDALKNLDLKTDSTCLHSLVYQAKVLNVGKNLQTMINEKNQEKDQNLSDPGPNRWKWETVKTGTKEGKNQKKKKVKTDSNIQKRKSKNRSLPYPVGLPHQMAKVELLQIVCHLLVGGQHAFVKTTLETDSYMQCLHQMVVINTIEISHITNICISRMLTRAGKLDFWKSISKVDAQGALNRLLHSKCYFWCFR